MLILIAEWVQDVAHVSLKRFWHRAPAMLAPFWWCHKLSLKQSKCHLVSSAQVVFVRIPADFGPPKTPKTTDDFDEFQVSTNVGAELGS